MKISVFRTLQLLLVGLLAVSGLQAQTSGSLRGTVTDSDGSPLPGVLVTATSESRGTSRSAVTSAAGSFGISALPVDTYTVKVDLEGFQAQSLEGVRISIAQAVSLEFELPLATVEETITVSSAPILDTSSSSVSTNYSADFVEDLPTTRNFWDMMAVSPGISQGSEGVPASRLWARAQPRTPGTSTA